MRTPSPRASVSLRSTEAARPRKSNPAPSHSERFRAPQRKCRKSFGSLKTEEKTERQCGQSFRGDLRVAEMRLSVNSAVGLPADGTGGELASRPIVTVLRSPARGSLQVRHQKCKSDRRLRIFQSGRRSPYSRSVTEATAEVIDRLLLESLILAQDERWRSA